MAQVGTEKFSRQLARIGTGSRVDLSLIIRSNNQIWDGRISGESAGKKERFAFDFAKSKGGVSGEMGSCNSGRWHTHLPKVTTDKAEGVTASEVVRNFALDADATTFRGVSLDWTPCHYGGYRAWFLCPKCRARVGKLYDFNAWGDHAAHSGALACRKCHGLAYASTRQGEQSRLLNRAGKIRRRITSRLSAWENLRSVGNGIELGASVVPWHTCPPIIPPRPRGMHHAVYERTLRKLEGVLRKFRQGIDPQNRPVSLKNV